MTNPLGPDDKAEKVEKEHVADGQGQAGGSGISYGDVMPLDAKENAARAQAEAQQKADKGAETPSGGTSTTIPRAPFTYYMGQKPQFQMRKSEFLQNKLDKQGQELKPLVDKFLKDTPKKEEHRLTDAEQRELEKTRESLAKVTNADDALNTALQLAKLYQHLRYMEEAKKATDLSLGIDPEKAAGHELFKELEHIRPADLGPSARPALKPNWLSKSNLRDRIMALPGGKVIVVGDIIVDEFLEGRPERISREAPVLILEHVGSEFVLGGAGNAANNVAALGGTCRAIGVCGRDQYATRLAELFEKAGVTQGLVQDSSRPTTVKTRVLSKSHSFKQQLLRLDRMSHEPISSLIESLIIDRLKQSSSQYSAIILSDYCGGVITDAVVKACRLIAEERSLKIAVDAQDRLERFQKVTILTPNEPDVERAVGFALNSEEALKRAGNELLDLTGAEAVLITRGARGLTLFEPGRQPLTIEPFNRSAVFDVTGAGDTVAATMTLALVTGANFAEAVALGNLAAGVVVRKPGTATCTQEELLAALDQATLPE
jgi:rfaE bifunctional protein kinase chain/domain